MLPEIKPIHAKFRLRWHDLTWVNGRNGVLLVTRGKTASARRVISVTPRVRDLQPPSHVQSSGVVPENAVTWPIRLSDLCIQTNRSHSL